MNGKIFNYQFELSNDGRLEQVTVLDGGKIVLRFVMPFGIFGEFACWIDSAINYAALQGWDIVDIANIYPHAKKTFFAMH